MIENEIRETTNKETKMSEPELLRKIREARHAGAFRIYLRKTIPVEMRSAWSTTLGIGRANPQYWPPESWTRAFELISEWVRTEKGATDVEKWLTDDFAAWLRVNKGRIKTKAGLEWAPAPEEIVHPVVADAVKRLRAGLNVLFYGPKGSGKTHAARQVADALHVPYFEVQCAGSASDTLFRGRLRPVASKSGAASSVYEPSPLVLGYECRCGAMERKDDGDREAKCDPSACGGLVCVDEIDRLPEDVGVVLNSALALPNGRPARFSIPARGKKPVAYRSQYSYIIATANTRLQGGNREYASAQRQDTALVDRFLGGSLFVGYEEDMERKLGPQDLVSAVHALRETVRNSGGAVTEVVGTRFIVHGAKLLAAGLTVDEVLSECARLWSDENRRRVDLPALTERW